MRQNLRQQFQISGSLLDSVGSFFKARMQPVGPCQVQHRHGQGVRTQAPNRPAYNACNPQNPQHCGDNARCLRREKWTALTPLRKRFRLHAQAHRFTQREKLLAKTDTAPQIANSLLPEKNFVYWRRGLQPSGQRLLACASARGAQQLK